MTGWGDESTDFIGGCQFCRDRHIQSHPFIASPVYDARLQGPLSFTNACVASLRALIRANEPYLSAE